MSICFSISGCATKVIYVPAPIPMPTLLYLPRLSNSEIECVSDSAYTKIAYLGMNAKHNINLLTTTIKSTWPPEND